VSDQPTTPAPKADPAVTTGTPAGAAPADTTPPAGSTPPAEPTLCPICFPNGLPEGYETAGCEHSA
jgi:hypothetical protein